MSCVAIQTHFERDVLSAPVPGRPDLRPIHVAESMEAFFRFLRANAPGGA
jgi:hypothetical protein